MRHRRRMMSEPRHLHPTGRVRRGGFAHTMFLIQMESYTQKNTTKRLVVIGDNDSTCYCSWRMHGWALCIAGEFEFIGGCPFLAVPTPYSPGA